MDLPAPASPNLDPVLVAAVMAVGVLVGLVLHANPATRRRHWVSLWGAVLLLALVWLTPLATLSQHYLLSAHLLQITIIMGVAPPLLLLALPRHTVVRAPRALRVLARVVTHPIVAVVAMNAAFFGWHTSGVYTAAMQNNWINAAEQMSLLLVSCAFWWPIITPLSPPVRAMTPLMKMGYILLATIPQTFGGLVVALAHHPLYPGYVTAPRVFGLDVLTDQQIAGASIALVSKIALFTAFIVIFMHALGSGVPDSDDGGGDGGIGPVIEPQPLPSGTPAWVLDLRRGRTVNEPRPRPRPRRRVRVPAGSGSGRG